MKRSFEVVFVHTYSHKTIPIFSIMDNSTFKNCLYYWIFAIVISVNVVRNSQKYLTLNSEVQDVGLAMWIASELLNGYSHLQLRKLRSKGSLGHFLPRGFLFNTITCPNYTFEILSWVGFTMYVQTYTAALFPVCGGVQMLLWADEKRKRLATKWPEVMHRGRITPFPFL